VGLKLNGSQQLLIYADDLNPFGSNFNTIRRNRDALIDSSREVGPEENTEKAKYI
jgi:hypothetical protein